MLRKTLEYIGVGLLTILAAGIGAMIIAVIYKTIKTTLGG